MTKTTNRKSIGQAVTNQAKLKAKQAVKKAVKKVAVSTVKNSLRTATGGASIAVEVALKFITSKTGKRVIAALLILNFFMLAFWITALFSLFVTIKHTNDEQAQLSLIQNEYNSVTNTPGFDIADITPGNVVSDGDQVQLQAFYDAGNSASIEWEIPLAVAYYESMGGQSVQTLPSACSSATYCPPTSTSPATPIKGAVGPFGLVTKALPVGGITASIASTPSAELIDDFTTLVAKAIHSQNPAQGATLLSGVSYTYQQVPVYNNTSDAQSYQNAVISGLGTLPIANNSEALDTNIYWLAWTWANGGPTTQLGTSGFGGQACYIPHGTSVQIPDNHGGLVT